MEGTAASWVIGLFALGIGTGLGVLLSRTIFKSEDNSKAEELNKQIETLKSEHQEYRQGVDQHFETTAELVYELTQNYRKVYEHLADGAQNLCLNPPEQLKFEATKGALYEAEQEAEQLAHQPATEAVSEEQAETAEAAEAQAESSEQIAAAVTEEQPETEAASETGIELEVQTKEKTSEQPTLH